MVIRLLLWLARWLGLAAFYLLFIDAVPTQERYAAVMAGGIGAIAFALLPRQKRRHAFRTSWLFLYLRRVLPGIIVDTYRVLLAHPLAVLRGRYPPGGRFVALPFDPRRRRSDFGRPTHHDSLWQRTHTEYGSDIRRRGKEAFSAAPALPCPRIGCWRPGVADVTVWIASALALLAAFIPIGIGCLRGGLMARFVAYQIGSLNAVLCVMTIAQGFGRPFLFDLALALAFLSLPSGLVFNHFYSRWIS